LSPKKNVILGDPAAAAADPTHPNTSVRNRARIAHRALTGDKLHRGGAR
jgi:hypothetical protein